MEIGQGIKKFRNLKGLTQKELAKELNVTTITIQNYENNRRKPDFVVLNEIADILDCKLFDLLGVENQDNPQEDPQSYFLEQYIRNLGYEIIFDDKDAYLILRTKDREYEITMNDLDDLKASAKSFIQYKLHEIINKSRKIGK